LKQKKQREQITLRVSVDKFVSARINDLAKENGVTRQEFLSNLITILTLSSDELFLLKQQLDFANKIEVAVNNLSDKVEFLAMMNDMGGEDEAT
jgi:hypothetical protein